MTLTARFGGYSQGEDRSDPSKSDPPRVTRRRHPGVVVHLYGDCLFSLFSFVPQHSKIQVPNATF